MANQGDTPMAKPEPPAGPSTIRQIALLWDSAMEAVPKRLSDWGVGPASSSGWGDSGWGK